MYQDVIMAAVMAGRELEDIKKKLENGSSIDELNKSFDCLIQRANLFKKYKVKGARRFGWKIKALKGLIIADLRRIKTTTIPVKVLIYYLEKRINDIEKNVDKLKDEAVLADKENRLIPLRV